MRPVRACACAVSRGARARSGRRAGARGTRGAFRRACGAGLVGSAARARPPLAGRSGRSVGRSGGAFAAGARERRVDVPWRLAIGAAGLIKKKKIGKRGKTRKKTEKKEKKGKNIKKTGKQKNQKKNRQNRKRQKTERKHKTKKKTGKKQTKTEKDKQKIEKKQKKTEKDRKKREKNRKKQIQTEKKRKI